MLSEVADSRLKAIKEFTEFGSGYKIAMRDLEIRGAGSLMGEIQHGHMEQVGYDMYCRLLDEVVKELRGEKVEEEKDIQIDINLSSYIPEEYISSNSQKIEVYQNIALCKTEEDILNVTDEIIDRYGPIPKEIENLLDIVRIKTLAGKKNILKIIQRNQNVLFYFDPEEFDFNIVNNLIKLYKNKIKFSPSQEPYITLNINEHLG
jgi:transcription-repair coupling factor (superfamily II helicase)